MKSKENILLLGGGGHCKSVIDVIEAEGRFKIAGIIDVQEKVGQEVLGYKIIATDKDLPLLVKDYKNLLITKGQIGIGEERKKLFEKAKKVGFNLPVVKSPLAYISRYAQIMEGSVIMHHAIINAGAVVGKNCIINTKAIVEHDAIIENHCHISTGAIINGGVIVKSGCFIGSNSTVRELVTIPENSFIKAGSVVKK